MFIEYCFNENNCNEYSIDNYFQIDFNTPQSNDNTTNEIL